MYVLRYHSRKQTVKKLHFRAKKDVYRIIYIILQIQGFHKHIFILIIVERKVFGVLLDKNVTQI